MRAEVDSMPQRHLPAVHARCRFLSLVGCGATTSGEEARATGLADSIHCGARRSSAPWIENHLGAVGPDARSFGRVGAESQLEWLALQS